VRLTRPVKLGAAALGAAVLGVSAASAVVGGSQEPTPPSQVPVAGSERIGPIVPDPAGGRDWAVRTYTSTSGASCVEVGRVSGGGRFGQEDASGTFHALALDESAVCGDLAAEPVIVAVNSYAARAQHEARTVLFGRATPAVAGVLVQRRDAAVEARPRIGSTGGFVLPLAGRIATSALPVTITLENGRRTVYDWK
jgi:hypothetical protein